MLKTFVTVATLKNFSAAARELHTVQPTISRQIADLEAELGVQLLWRNTREVKMTPAGESLLRDAQDILARESLAKEQARRAARGQIGRLKIGYIGSAGYGFIPELVQTYTKHYPDVQVTLREMTVKRQIKAFKTGELDIGFSRPLPETERQNLTAEEIYIDTLIAVVPESHPLAIKKSLHLNQLETDNFVLFKRNEAIGLFDQIISACQTDHFSPKISNQAENMQTVLTEVAAGLGVSVVPSCVKQMYTKGCVFIPIEKQRPSIPTELHYRTEPIDATVQAFVNITINAKADIQKQMLA